MEKTFILGNSEVCRHIEGNFIEIPTLTSDYEIHNWIVSLFVENETDKVVIEIGDNNILSLKIGYHIRLSLNELKNKSLVPLFFVSTSTLNAIIIETGAWSHIFASDGVYFSSLNHIENITIELSLIKGIPISNYKTNFLDVIKIRPNDTIGLHSLANIWGAFTLDKVANTNALTNDDNLKNRNKELYFKYISAFNNIKLLSIKTIGFLNLEPPNIINAKNKRILLIDDEADKGWDKILRKIFNVSSQDDFIVIKERVKDYDYFSTESKNIIENTSFDLYLIDLRLNGVEEDDILNPIEFSGMKILKKIKSLNEGSQVIIFTASNKVWNLKALLDAGADGYYMKESPEFGFSSDFSKQNYQRFQEDVKLCFQRGFLQILYVSYQNILQIIDNISHYPDDFKAEIKNQIQLFWNMIFTAKTPIQFAYAFITLYQVIEIVNNYFVKKTLDGKWEIKDCGNLLNWEWNKDSQNYMNSNIEIMANKPPEWQKIAGIYFQKFKQTENQLIQDLYFIIQKRNGFVHGDKNILDWKNEQDTYLNKDIYNKNGSLSLFSAVSKLIDLVAKDITSL